MSRLASGLLPALQLTSTMRSAIAHSDGYRLTIRCTIRYFVRTI